MGIGKIAIFELFATNLPSLWVQNRHGDSRIPRNSRIFDFPLIPPGCYAGAPLGGRNTTGNGEFCPNSHPFSRFHRRIRRQWEFKIKLKCREFVGIFWALAQILGPHGSPKYGRKLDILAQLPMIFEFFDKSTAAGNSK